MGSAASSIRIPSQTLKNQVNLAFLFALLFLRIGLLTGTRMIFKSSTGWVEPLFDLSTYLLTIGFILWEKDRLADFHIDTLAIWIIVLFKPLETLYLGFVYPFTHSPLAFPQLPSLVIWAAAIFLLVALRISHFPWPQIARKNANWLLVGAGAGVGLALLLAYPMSFQVSEAGPVEQIGWFSFLFGAVSNIPYQVGYAAVTEEPVFRGLLWGVLRHAGWKNGWIWLFQAGLFMLSHAYYAAALPISFWIIVPAGALAFGLLAWRSRSIATSMAAHGFLNGLGYSAGYLLAAIRNF